MKHIDYAKNVGRCKNPSQPPICEKCGACGDVRRTPENGLSHAVPVKDVEPLAVLADRKGWYIQDILPPVKACPGWEINLCSKEINKESIYDKFNCEAPTYPACEAKARAYLEGLEDVKGGM